MSKNLQAAILSGAVTVRSKQSGEINVWYRDIENERKTLTIPGKATREIAPKLTSAPKLKFSNVGKLVNSGALEIVLKSEKDEK